MSRDSGTPDPPTGTDRVLVVGDGIEADTLSGLASDRYDVVAASGVDEAVDVVEETRIDCVTSEYDLPDADGFDLLSAVRNRAPDVSFVLLAREGSEAVAAEAVSRDVDEYVRPTSAEPGARLGEAVDDALGDGEEPAGPGLHHSPSPVAVVDSDGRIAWANDATADLLGLESPEEVVGERALAFIHPNDREEARERLGRVLEEREAAEPTEQRYRRPDGSVGHAVIATAPVTFDGEPAAQAMLNDITDYKRTEEALRHQQRFTEDLLDALNDIFYVVGEDGTFVRWNERASEVLGYTDAELATLRPEDVVAPADLDRLSAIREAGGTEDPVEVTLVTRGGERIPYEVKAVTLPDDDGEPLVQCGICRDVTERKRREEALRASERRFRAVFEEAFDAMVIADDGGTYIDANEAAADLFGCPREDLVGRSVDEFAAESYDVDAAWEEFRSSEAERGTFELVRDDGEVRVTEYSATADVVPGGNLSILRDVTERVELERRLAENERRYRTLVEMAPMAVVVSRDGEVVFGNEAAVDLLGTEGRDDLAGRDVGQFFPADVTDDIDEMARQIQAGAAVGLSNDRTVHGLDGSRREVQAVSRRIDYEGEPAVLTVLNDVTERRRYEQGLDALHRTTRDLIRASGAGEVFEEVVETAERILDIPNVAAYRFDREDSRLVPVASAGRGESLFGTEELPTFERGESLLWQTFPTGEPTYYPDVTTREAVYNPETPVRTEFIVPLGNHGVLVAGAPEVDALDEVDRDLVEVLAANATVAFDRVRTEEAIRERDRRLAEQNERLEELDHINAVIRDVHGALVDASTRGAIERTVPERLADTDRYTLAWLGRSDGAGGIDPVARAGVEANYLDRLVDRDDDPVVALARRAVETGTVRAVRGVLDGGDWRDHSREALTYGYDAVAAVPVEDDGGDAVLVLYAESADAFGERERAVLAELGTAVGHAIASVEETRAVLAEDYVDVDLTVGGDRLVFNRLSAAADCEVELRGLVPLDGGETLAFVTTVGAPPDRVSAAVADVGTVTEARRLAADGDTGVYEFRLETPALADLFADRAATLVSLTASDGASEVGVRLPGDADVRAFVDAVAVEYADVDLLARRQRTEPVETTRSFRATLDDRLTDRQAEALRTAYYGGFYAWPRETTGADLADSLGIAAPTFQYHLRAAERKLVSALLDPAPDDSR